MPVPSADSYRSRGDILVYRLVEEIPVPGAIEPVVEALNSHRGVLLASSYEYPGRYTRWDMGFADPPIALVTCGQDFRLSALNERGRVLLPAITEAVRSLSVVAWTEAHGNDVVGAIQMSFGRFPEEQRSKQPSVFSLLRALMDLFFSPADPHLGLYGAFGYDLAFQFEPIHLRLERPPDQRDLVLYLPDELITVDHRRQRAARHRYDFEVAGRSTHGLPRHGEAQPYVGSDRVKNGCDHAPGEYAGSVRVAREAFRRGDLFEVVPGQIFFEPCPAPPSELFLLPSRARSIIHIYFPYQRFYPYFGIDIYLYFK